ncbi:MAG: DUF2922 domain-containing protein [Mogibacterium sp.]|nr:DUF2922 domain-containing protein [Mogibacterium sp.]
MATVNTLVLEFDGSGSTVKFSYKYADPTITSQQVQTLMQTIITNGTIFENPPLVAKSAKLVATTETSYTIS